MKNSDKYPEAWIIFAENARNIKGTEDGVNGDYCIPNPITTNMMYANDPLILFNIFKNEFYRESLTSPSVRGKIQYIVNNL